MSSNPQHKGEGQTAPQLTIDGGEEILSVEAPKHHSPLTHAQSSILLLIAERGKITSSEAGEIVHLHRAPPCARCVEHGRCGFTSSDGRDALKRLQARGFVIRLVTGVWEGAHI